MSSKLLPLRELHPLSLLPYVPHEGPENVWPTLNRSDPLGQNSPSWCSHLPHLLKKGLTLGTGDSGDWGIGIQDTMLLAGRSPQRCPFCPCAQHQGEGMLVASGTCPLPCLTHH